MYVAREEWDPFARVIGLEGNDSRLLVRYYFFIVTVGVVAPFSSLSLFFKRNFSPFPFPTELSVVSLGSLTLFLFLHLISPTLLLVELYMDICWRIFIWTELTSTRTMGGLSLNKLLNRTLSILCPWFLLRWRVSFHFTARNCLETRRHSVLKSHARTCRPSRRLMEFVFFHLFCTTLLLGLSSLPRVARASRCEFCNDQCVEDCTRGNR